MADGGLEKALGSKIAGVPAWGLGVGFAAILVAYFVYRSHKQNAAAATPTTPTTPVDPTTVDPNAIDPLTGMSYGQEGYGGTPGYPSTPIDSYLANNPTNPAYPTGLTPQGLPGPVTNVQWSTLVADYLLAKGDDPTLVETALSRYISGQTLSQAQQAIVSLALQYFGSPPEGVKAPVAGGTSGKPDDPSGLHATTVKATSISLAWTAVSGADKYHVYLRKGSSTMRRVATVTSPSHIAGGLSRNTTYTCVVSAENSAGEGAKSAPITEKTKKV